MKAETLDFKWQSMRNNIVIMRIKEENIENYPVIKNFVKQFMKKELKMSEEQAAEAIIERAQILSWKKDLGKPRPSVVSILNFKIKMVILEHGRELKGTQFFGVCAIPCEFMERRCILYPIMKNNRAKKQQSANDCGQIIHQYSAVQGLR